MLGGAGAGKDLCSPPAPGTKRPGAPQPGTPAFQLQQVVCEREDLNIVQVGACDGNFKSSNDPLQSALARPAVRAALVEANPAVFPTLERNIRAKFGDVDRIKAWNIAICPSDAWGTEVSLAAYLIPEGRASRAGRQAKL